MGQNRGLDGVWGNDGGETDQESRQNGVLVPILECGVGAHAEGAFLPGLARSGLGGLSSDHDAVPIR